MAWPVLVDDRKQCGVQVLCRVHNGFATAVNPGARQIIMRDSNAGAGKLHTVHGQRFGEDQIGQPCAMSQLAALLHSARACRSYVLAGKLPLMLPSGPNHFEHVGFVLPSFAQRMIDVASFTVPVRTALVSNGRTEADAIVCELDTQSAEARSEQLGGYESNPSVVNRKNRNANECRKAITHR